MTDTHPQLEDDPNAAWPSSIPVITTSDPVLGGDSGTSGPVNVPHKLLNDRVLFLKAHSVDVAVYNAHAADRGAHGAASAVPATGGKDAIIRRDASGRAQVAAPSDGGDIANKKYVDDGVSEAVSAVAGDIAGHVAATTAHGAVSAATADRLVLRDSAGRARVSAPSDGGDIANKTYVDGRPAPKAGTATALSGTAFKITVQTGQTAAAGSTNTAAGAFGIFIAADSAATARTVMIRDASGNASVAAPTADDHVATKVYVDGRALTPGPEGAQGVGFWGWSTASNLANISSVPGSKVGDYFINTGAASRTMLGKTAAPGDVVKSTSATAGDLAGNIRGPQGLGGDPGAAGPAGVSLWAWSSSSNLTNISSVSGSSIGDHFVNTGAAPRTMLGVTAAIGDVVKSSSATAGALAGNIRGAQGEAGASPARGPAFWGVTGILNTIAGVLGSAVGDYFVSLLDTDVKWLNNLLVAPGDVVKATGASAGTIVGNIRGPAGGLGDTDGWQKTQVPSGAGMPVPLDKNETVPASVPVVCCLKRTMSGEQPPTTAGEFGYILATTVAPAAGISQTNQFPTLVRRDGSGRARMNPPASTADIATAQWVLDAILDKCWDAIVDVAVVSPIPYTYPTLRFTRMSGGYKEISLAPVAAGGTTGGGSAGPPGGSVRPEIAIGPS
jgi:hypothetical protein